MKPTGVDDCLDQIPNRFELCAVAAKRARQLARGADSVLPVLGHKATVQSLAEIALGHVSRAILDDSDLPLPERPSQTFDPAESADELIGLPDAFRRGP